MTFDQDQPRIAAALNDLFAPYDVPPAPLGRIVAEAARRRHARRPARGRLRLVILAGLAAAVLAVVLVPQFSRGVVEAARTFLGRPWTVWRGDGPRRVVKMREISLAAARSSPAVHFIEPKGLPAGSRLVSVGEARDVHSALTLVYRTPDDRVFSIDEIRAGARSSRVTLPPQSCIDIRASRFATLEDAIRDPAMRPYLDTDDPKTLPRGVKAVPCARTSIDIGGTYVSVRNLGGRLTDAEIDTILRATSH